ncbi:hypothetical protein KM043_016812 [Ampulex compressa]|nr:hypothetical protein KM043_016812 [Ampulex compressa]
MHQQGDCHALGNSSRCISRTLSPRVHENFKKVPPRQAHFERSMKKGAIFEQGTDEVQSAFRFAMFNHNQNTTTRKFELQAFVDVINTADAFKLSRLICRQFSRGVYSMLGAVSPDSFDTLHSYSNTFQMPFVTPWFPEKVLTPSSGLLDFAISMRPDYHRAIIDTVRYYGWKKIIYLYDSHDVGNKAASGVPESFEEPLRRVQKPTVAACETKVHQNYEKMMDLEIFRQILIGIVCNLLIIDSGLQEGWSTPMIPKFNNEDPLSLTSSEIVWIVNSLYVGVGIGSVFPFLLMDRIGRKGTLIFATIPKIASWILIGLSVTVTQIFIGRILGGIGCGITYAVMPMYLGEVTSKRTRGPLGTLMAVLLNIGLLVSYSMGLSMSRFSMSMASVCVPVVFLLAFAWLPESSVFLTRKNKLSSAEKTLQWALGKQDVNEELEEIKRIVATEEQCTKLTFFESLKETYTRRENCRAFRIALIVLSALTLTGTSPILVYQSYIFEEAGFDVSVDVAIVVTGCAIVCAGSTCVLLVRRVGKRSLLLLSTPICIVSLVMIAGFFSLLSAGYDVSGFKWVPTVFVVIHVVGYGLALNPIPLAYISEIFHFKVKVPAAIFCSLFYALSTTGVVKFYQVAQELCGTQVPFWTFAVITFLIWTLIYRYVPETEGKSLEEIQMELRRKPGETAY